MKHDDFVEDIELIKLCQDRSDLNTSNKSLLELWNRYKMLLHKMRWQLIECARHNDLGINEVVKEYDSYAWEKFVNAVNSIRPEDCAHIKNWKFYIQLWGYLRSLNRDLIHENIHYSKHNIPIDYYETKDSDEESINIVDKYSFEHNNDLESQFMKKMKKKVFWDSINILKKQMTPKQKILMGYRQRGRTKHETCQFLKISGQIYDDNLLMIKRMLIQAMAEASKNNSYEVSYGDYVN